MVKMIFSDKKSTSVKVMKPIKKIWKVKVLLHTKKKRVKFT